MKAMSSEARPTGNCPFCALDGRDVIASNHVAVALFDGSPVSLGHALVVPRRHVVSVFELSKAELAALGQLVADARTQLTERFSPAGFNIGINEGIAAGQTVPHAHLHLIPRYQGDVADPRGGIRWVLGAKADYWSR